MNPEQLLQHFDRISEAPDAIPKLRRFILDLAVRGKLVEQDPNDEPAAELLKRIQTEESKTRTAKKPKQVDGKPRNDTSEFPFAIPASWAWTRIGQLGQTQTGTTPSKSEGEIYGNHIPFIKPGDLFPNCVDYSGEGLSEIGLKSSGRLAPEGSILMVCIGTIGKCQLIDRDCSFNQQINALTPQKGLVPKYLLSACLSEFFQQSAWLASARTTIAILNKGKWEQLFLPIPPLAEQHRIVAKVDELMALCDQLQAAQTEREQSRDRLVAASLHSLNPPADDGAANTPETQREHARFIFNHLPRLTTRPAHIKQLRQTILNLAVRGKLVTQDSNDEPVSLLAKHVEILIRDDEPFSVPSSWHWISVDQISKSRLGKMLDKAKNKGTPRRYLRNVNVRWFEFDLSDVYEMPFEDSELEEFMLLDGDVLICEGGEPGRAAVWDERETGIYFQKAIHRVRFPTGVNPHYFVKVIREAADSDRLQTYFTGVGIKHFTGKGLASFLIPLPPLAEQHRIVAKVDELMALCDQLESQLADTATDSRRLLEALLHEALLPTEQAA